METRVEGTALTRVVVEEVGLDLDCKVTYAIDVTTKIIDQSAYDMTIASGSPEEEITRAILSTMDIAFILTYSNGMPYSEIGTSADQLANAVVERISDTLASLGMEVESLKISELAVDEANRQIIDKFLNAR